MTSSAQQAVIRDRNPALEAKARFRRFEFVVDKYGEELLVDVGSTRELPGFRFHRTAHQLMFYDVLLVRKGNGQLLQERWWHEIRPSTVVFHRPGEVRRWRIDSDAEGIVLFFTADFLRTFLRERALPDRLPFFDGGSRSLQLDEADGGRLEQRLESMRAELRRAAWGWRQALQAATVETLVWLTRRHLEQHGATPRPPDREWYRRFEATLERDFRKERSVDHYARACGVSPSHLNALLREHTGLSVGQSVRARVLSEARRALLHSGQTVSEIAGHCGFDDPSYFCRFFRREVGHSPARYREIVGKYP